MPAILTRPLKKSWSHPDEVQELPKAKIEFLELDGQTVMCATLQPGWKWSEHMKPEAGTDNCEARHLGCLLSGRMKSLYPDGTEIVYQAGDCVLLPPGHQSSVEGNEPAVFLDFGGGEKIRSDISK